MGGRMLQARTWLDIPKSCSICMNSLRFRTHMLIF